MHNDDTGTGHSPSSYKQHNRNPQPEGMSAEAITALDKKYLWHPYSAVDSPLVNFPVKHAQACEITLAGDTVLLDGMASWWSVIHGYNHPELNAAAVDQLNRFSHVMFGGLTHEPAVTLAQKLIALSPPNLDKVFFSDSGSVAVEIAMKMAIQFWQAKGQKRHRFVSLRNAYHGDTFAAMSVCDPVTGMHHIFNEALSEQYFVDSPKCQFGDSADAEQIRKVASFMHKNHTRIAAFILEPIVQGTGGMRFYSSDYLTKIAEICRDSNVLLIADEIATGFGRTGKLFACEHAKISPDIMCVGKSLSAGYLSLAATLCSNRVANTICSAEPGVFMHGPTFMANPLACAIANKSIDLLLAENWQENIKRIERALQKGLQRARNFPGVADVRVLGAIGVIELKEPVNMSKIQAMFVKNGIWLRPFGKLVYTMPPYIMSDAELSRLTSQTLKTLENYLA